MRKVMLLAAMLAMVLAAAAPAFAQAVGGDVSVQYVDCSQVQAAAAAQGQYGDAVAVDAASAAAIAQELGITQEQVNACLGGVAAGGDILVGPEGGTVEAGATAAATAGAEAAAGAAAGGEAAAAAGGALPETGGASLLALGAGALLVAGGLLARRIVR